MSNDPFIAQPQLMDAIVRACEARQCAVEDLAAEIDAVAAWTTRVDADLLEAMVRGTFLPSPELTAAIVAVLNVADDIDLFEVHPDVARLLAGRRLTDDDVGRAAATRARALQRGTRPL